jgi:hypothetical protein
MMRHKAMFFAALAAFLYMCIALYGQIRAAQECVNVGGVALRKAWGGVYCFSPNGDAK